MDIANSGLQSRETDMLESESHKQHEVETTDEMESRDPGAARKLHRSESHGRQTKTTLVSQTTRNDDPTKEWVATGVTPPMTDPITSSRPKRANAGKRITVFLAQRKSVEYTSPSEPPEATPRTKSEARKARADFEQGCGEHPEMAAAMYAIAALATAEEAKVTEEQRSAAVRAEILNILNFEVLQWVRRKEVAVVEWLRRVLLFTESKLT